VLARVRERDPQLDPLLGRGLRRPSVQPDPGRLSSLDLDFAQAEVAAAQRLQRCLLGAEAGRQVLSRTAPGARVLELGGGENAIRQARMALEGALEALDLQQVDADRGRDRYLSTPITVLVRPRSPSSPLPVTR
jgi:hypothetical protein